MPGKPPPPTRGKSVRVKTARGRKVSSTRWLQRQLNDPYVQQAKRDGYRSRAAYKLIELDERFALLAPGRRVVDLGAAPGGWTQVAVQKVKGARVVGLDLKEIDAIPGAELLVGDMNEEEAIDRVKAALGGQADVVLSDMAPNASGSPQLDHLRIMILAEAALAFALEVLAPGGMFVCKAWQGGSEKEFLVLLKTHFAKVKHAKPKASRADSAETYVVAWGFKAPSL